MKKQKFVGKIVYANWKSTSVYGNPSYWAGFENENGERLDGYTASNASCGYGIRNDWNVNKEITYHETRTGSIIFDYIKTI